MIINKNLYFTPQPFACNNLGCNKLGCNIFGCNFARKFGCYLSRKIGIGRKSFFISFYISRRNFSITHSLRQNSKPGNVTPKFITLLLNSFNDPNNTFTNSEQSQRVIENIIFEDYESAVSSNTNRFITGGIKVDILGPILNKYILSKREIILIYINNLRREQQSKLDNSKLSENFDIVLMATIITSLDINILYSLCISQFLLTYSYQDTEEVKQFGSVPVSVSLGKKMFARYINSLRDQHIKETGQHITYTLWLEKWIENNPELYTHLDDSILSKLGCKILDILMYSDLLDIVLTKSSNKQYPFNALQIKDKSLMSRNNRQSVVNLPLKLPMICSPKPYGHNALGGYCLNDEKFAEQLFIEKKAYACTSELSGEKLYTMVNNISNTPFKINQPLLDYINAEGDKHKLLIDTETEHEYESLPYRTKSQKSILASHKSKILLQETILGLAEFYRRFSKIYFPVRLDQRGRLYCSPVHLNYQSNELSKALLLFANGSIISKQNAGCIIYLKAYGVNCFGGSISKTSLASKSEWVNKNLHNIINYDNGILLAIASDKLLFLAFCMEYKRFYEFYTN